jgi:hypothetical protein
MEFARIVDLDESAVQASEYDLAIFSSGYEVRSTYLARRLGELRYRHGLVLGFHDALTNRQRRLNDTYFEQSVRRPRLTSATSDVEVLQLLREVQADIGSMSRIFVDYSSMSKLWYAAVLSWARFQRETNLVIDFAYAVGRPSIPYRHSSVRKIEAIPGFEVSTGSEGGVLLLGLGFDRFTALSVVEQMEPDRAIAFLADPSADPKYAKYAKSVHALLRDTIEIGDAISIPLDSVESAFRLLSEIVQPFRSTARVTIVPLGPKTHVLASLLVSMRFPHVGCLRVSTGTTTRASRPTQQIVLSRVEFQSDLVVSGKVAREVA